MLRWRSTTEAHVCRSKCVNETRKLLWFAKCFKQNINNRDKVSVRMVCCFKRDSVICYFSSFRFFIHPFPYSYYRGIAQNPTVFIERTVLQRFFTPYCSTRFRSAFNMNSCDFLFCLLLRWVFSPLSTPRHN